MSKNENKTDLEKLIDKLKNALDTAKKCKRDSDNVELRKKLIKNMRKTATFRRLLILTPRDFDWIGYSNSRDLINNVGEVSSVGNIASSILLAIILWFTVFPVSPINLPSYINEYKLSWVLSSIAFISLASSMMYFIISSVKQAILSIKTLKDMADIEEKNVAIDEEYYNNYIKLAKYIEYFIKIASKYNNINEPDSESAQLVTKAGKMCLDFFDAYDKSLAIQEIEEVKAEIDDIETNADYLEKYQLDSEKLELLNILTRGAEKALVNVGIYRSRLERIIEKAKTLVRMHSKSEVDTVRNLVNIIIPEVIELCSSSSSSENENVIEALDITESKIDSMINSSEKVFNIKAKSTVSAIKQMLK